MNESIKNSVFRDVVSGTIMAATSVPQLIAYSETVGYASYRGLSTAGPPYVFFSYIYILFLCNCVGDIYLGIGMLL